MTSGLGQGTPMLPQWLKVALLTFNTAFGLYVGYCLGFYAAYYAGDHGDVGSAFISAGTVPVGILLCTGLAYGLTVRGLRGLDGTRCWKP